jgi:hypothetical protein
MTTIKAKGQALAKDNQTELSLEDQQIGVLTEELRTLIRQTTDSTNAYLKWCYEQDARLQKHIRTAASPLFLSHRNLLSLI